LAIIERNVPSKLATGRIAVLPPLAAHVPLKSARLLPMGIWTPVPYMVLWTQTGQSPHPKRHLDYFTERCRRDVNSGCLHVVKVVSCGVFPESQTNVAGCLFAGNEEAANDGYAYNLQVCFLKTNFVIASQLGRILF